MLLRPGIRRGQQHALRGLPESHVLLFWTESHVSRGHFLAPAVLGPPELLVHQRAMGASRRPVHPVLGWQVQPLPWVQGLFQHDRPGLQPVRAGHCFQRLGQEYDL